MFYWTVVKYFGERFPVHKTLPKRQLSLGFARRYCFSVYKPSSNCSADYLHHEQEDKVCTEELNLVGSTEDF